MNFVAINLAELAQSELVW